MSGVEDALLHLARRGPGEPAEDGGFAEFDSAFGHALAERVYAGVPLTGKQRRAAARMLRRYADQLRDAGVEWSDIDATEDSPAVTQVERRAVRRGDPPRAEVANGRIVVRSPFELKSVCKAIPGARWTPQVPPRGAWTYPESPNSAWNVVEAFRPYDLVADDAIVALVASAQVMRDARRHKTAEELPPVPGESLASWLHQRQAFWFAREQDAVMLAMDMGTGKSKVTVDLLRENGARRSIIVCPLKVLGVWPKQFQIHGGDAFHVVNGQVQMRSGEWVPDTVDARVRSFDDALHECSCGRSHVVVVNYEATAYEPLRTWALEQVWDYAVLDESHRVRAPQGVWSRWVAKLRDRSARRVCLTGTPLGQTPLDAFGQYRFLDPTIFGTSYTSFEHRYAVKGGYQGYEILGMRTSPTMPDGRPNPSYSPELEREFDERFFSVAYEVGAEVLDLPDVMDVTRTFDLPGSAMRIYRRLDDEMFAEWEAGGEVTTPNVLVKMLRLQQLTGGAVNNDEGQLVEVHQAKEELLEDVLTDIDPHEPVVVFCRFVHDLDVVQRVTTKLKRQYAELSGRRSDALARDSTLAIDRGVAAVQIQAGGVGVDFTAARFGIYYSLGFSLIDFKQSRKRLHRPGQERPVLFVHLVANSTIDVDVYEALARNEQSVDEVLKRRLMERVG